MRGKALFGEKNLPRLTPQAAQEKDIALKQWRESGGAVKEKQRHEQNREKQNDEVGELWREGRQRRSFVSQFLAKYFHS